MELWGRQEISWNSRGGGGQERRKKERRLDDYREFLLFCKPHGSGMGICWRSVIHQGKLLSSGAVCSALCRERNAQRDTWKTSLVRPTPGKDRADQRLECARDLKRALGRTELRKGVWCCLRADSDPRRHPPSYPSLSRQRKKVTQLWTAWSA